MKNQNFNPHVFSFLLAIFVGLATYSIFAFFELTGRYVEHYGANVMGSSEVEEADDFVPTESMENPFVDLPEEHPFRDGLLYLYYEGIFDPELDKVRPDDKVSRAEFARMVMESAGFDYASYGVVENCYKDVKTVEEHWFAPFVCSATAEGLFKGFEDGNFYPARDVLKAEAVSVVLKAFGHEIPGQVDEVSFAGMSPTEWYAPVAQAGLDNGIIGGDAFDAAWSVTRGEVAQMIYNAAYTRY